MNYKDLQQLMTNEEMGIFKRELTLSPLLLFTYMEWPHTRLIIFFDKKKGCVYYYQQDREDPRTRAFMPNTWVLRKCEGEDRNPDSIISCHKRSNIGMPDSCCFSAGGLPLCKSHGIP